MFTILAFLLSTAGSINWLMIGLFQYDFIAGIFGLQASILSRLCYILFGFSCFVLVFKLIKGKGAISVFSKRNTKDLEKNMAKMQSKLNAEASSEETKARQHEEKHENDHQIFSDRREDEYNSPNHPTQEFDRHYRR